MNRNKSDYREGPQGRAEAADKARERRRWWRALPTEEKQRRLNERPSLEVLGKLDPDDPFAK